MTDPDIVARLRLYAERQKQTRSTVLGLLLSDSADEIERLRARPCCLERLEQIRELEAALRDRNTELQRVRDQRDAMRSAYSTAEQTALELFLQRNAAREALERHADGEGR